MIPPLAGLGDWEATMALSNALGYPMNYSHPSEIMDEIARLTPTFAGVSFAKLDALGSIQWPCNDAAPHGTPVMHIGKFVRGKGRFMLTEFVPTEERTGARFPLILTTGRILSQYNVGAQTRRTENVAWHEEDVLEIHPFDAENRGVRTGDLVAIQSRSGEISLRAVVSERMQPGVVYTTFHHPMSGANVVTTEFSDWATNCPEYKVTAVQVRRTNGPSAWQEQVRRRDARRCAGSRRSSKRPSSRSVGENRDRKARQAGAHGEPDRRFLQALSGREGGRRRAGAHPLVLDAEACARSCSPTPPPAERGSSRGCCRRSGSSAAAESPAEKVTAGPEKVGQLASDAG